MIFTIPYNPKFDFLKNTEDPILIGVYECEEGVVCIRKTDVLTFSVTGLSQLDALQLVFKNVDTLDFFDNDPKTQAIFFADALGLELGDQLDFVSVPFKKGNMIESVYNAEHALEEAFVPFNSKQEELDICLKAADVPPTDFINVPKLIEDRENAAKHNKEIRDKYESLRIKKKQLQERYDEYNTLLEELTEAEKYLRQLYNEAIDLRTECEALTKFAETAIPIDMESYDERLKNVNLHNIQALKYREKLDLERQKQSLIDEYQPLLLEKKVLRQLKKKLTVDFPFDVGFSTGLKVNGKFVHELSKSDKIEFYMSILATKGSFLIVNDHTLDLFAEAFNISLIHLDPPCTQEPKSETSTTRLNEKPLKPRRKSRRG